MESWTIMNPLYPIRHSMFFAPLHQYLLCVCVYEVKRTGNATGKKSSRKVEQYLWKRPFVSSMAEACWSRGTVYRFQRVLLWVFSSSQLNPNQLYPPLRLIRGCSESGRGPHCTAVVACWVNTSARLNKYGAPRIRHLISSIHACIKKGSFSNDRFA